MSEQSKATATMEEKQKQTGLWSAGIFTALGLIFFIYSIYNVVALQQGRMDLSDKVLMPMTALLFVVSIISYGLIQRGRHALGTGLLFFIGTLVLPITSVLLLKGMVYVAILYIVSLAIIMIGLVLPNNTRRIAMIATLAAALLCVGIEYWNPSFRLNTEIGNFTTFITTLAVLGLSAYFIRQAWNSNIRVKLATAFMLITMVSVLIVAFPAQRSLSNSVTAVIDNNLSELSNARAIEIAVSIDREKDILKVLSLNQAIRDAALEAASAAPLSQADITRLDEQWRAADAADNNADPLVAGVINNTIASELRNFRGQFPQHVEVFLTNTQGLSIASTNRTSDYLQADEEWWQTAYQNGVFIGQPEYDDSSKTIAMIMAVRVRENGDGRVLGVLRTTVNFTTLTDTLALGLFGQTGRTNIYLPDGRELKLNIKADKTVELVEAAAPSEITVMTQSASKNQTISLNGIPVLASMAVVRTIGNTTEDTALISGLDWRVVTLQDQAEAQQPVTDQTRNTTILVFAIITVVAFAGSGLVQ